MLVYLRGLEDGGEGFDELREILKGAAENRGVVGEDDAELGAVIGGEDLELDVVPADQGDFFEVDGLGHGGLHPRRL